MTREGDLTRRQALRRGVLALGVGLAGCTGDADGTANSSPSTPGDGPATDEPTFTEAPPPSPDSTPTSPPERTPTPSPQSTPTPRGSQERDDETVTTTTQSSVAWRLDLEATVEAIPTVDDGILYVGGWRETSGTPTPGSDARGPSTTVRSLDLAEGGERLRLDVGAPVQDRLRVVDDRIYVVRGYDGLHGHGYELRAVSTDGQELWRHEANSLKFLSVLGADESGVVVGENDDNLGQGTEETVALAPDGSVKWRRETTDVYSGAVDAETAYVTDHRRRVRAFDRTSGERRWTVEREARISEVTAVEDGVVASGDRVFALSGADGSLRWTLEAQTPAGLFVDDGQAVVPTEDGRLVVVDVSDGNQVWSIHRGDSAPVAVDDDVVSVGRPDGTVTAYDRSTGERLWEADVGERTRLHAADGRVYAVQKEGVVVLSAGDGSRVGSVTVEGDPQWVFSADARDALVTRQGLVYGLSR